MERPALQRLLADIAAGRIDIVVVYKVDRLTSALSDFARIVVVQQSNHKAFLSHRAED
jgi:site-specific DNA recombinase